MAGGSAGCEFAADPRLRRIERFIATVNGRAEVVEKTGPATRKAAQDGNNLDFSDSPTLFEAMLQRGWVLG